MFDTALKLFPEKQYGTSNRLARIPSKEIFTRDFQEVHKTLIFNKTARIEKYKIKCTEAYTRKSIYVII